MMIMHKRIRASSASPATRPCTMMLIAILSTAISNSSRTSMTDTIYPQARDIALNCIDRTVYDTIVRTCVDLVPDLTLSLHLQNPPVSYVACKTQKVIEYMPEMYMLPATPGKLSASCPRSHRGTYVQKMIKQLFISIKNLLLSYTSRLTINFIFPRQTTAQESEFVRRCCADFARKREQWNCIQG